jgi:hypothetical protein
MSDFAEDDDAASAGGYWPSVADLFLTLFIVAIAMIAAVFCALLPTNNVGLDKAIVNAVGNDLRNLRVPVNRLRDELGLTPIAANAVPTAVVAAVGETCDAAVQRIREFERQIERLDGSGDLTAEINRLLKENAELQRKLIDVQKAYQDLLAQKGGRDPEKDRPPNIQISEQKEEYRFASGSSWMAPKFINGLTGNEFARLAQEIVERQQPGRVKVDTLEIIGHTDGEPLARGGNLDVRLPEVLAGKAGLIYSLIPGSNNDLGLLRALAVREQWERFIQTHPERDALMKIQVRCYSAGQTVLPEPVEGATAQTFKQPNPKARRIEMRLTRLLD